MERRLVALLLALIAVPAVAQMELLPKSHHQQFLTYGLFNEEQVIFVMRGENRAWGAIGDSFAVLGNQDWPGKPQLLINGSVTTSFVSKGSALDFIVETFDARFGLFVEFLLSEEWRLQVGARHNSGHTSDGLKDLNLVAPNFNQDAFQLRVVRDFDTHFRVGGTIDLLVTREPSVQALELDQFIDYFPFGNATGLPVNVQPFVSVGFSEGGVDGYDFTYHAQLGVHLGDHFAKEKQTAIRVVLGYYHGVDPRLKYQVIMHSHWDFFYGGVMLNL